MIRLDFPFFLLINFVLPVIPGDTLDGIRKGSRRKFLAIGIAVLLAAGGLAAVSLANASGQATSENSSGSTVFSGQYLEVVVWTYSNGHRIPVEGANVTVYSVSISRALNGTITVTLARVEGNVTNSHGAAYFNLAGGHYAVIAKYGAQRGYAAFRLDDYKTIFIRLR